jgi:hypothetical protein
MSHKLLRLSVLLHHIVPRPPSLHQPSIKDTKHSRTQLRANPESRHTKLLLRVRILNMAKPCNWPQETSPIRSPKCGGIRGAGSSTPSALSLTNLHECICKSHQHLFLLDRLKRECYTSLPFVSGSINGGRLRLYTKAHTYTRAYTGEFLLAVYSCSRRAKYRWFPTPRWPQDIKSPRSN